MLSRDEKDKVQKLWKLRPLYIWGARQQGQTLLRYLREQGYEPKGFIDNNPLIQQDTFLGLPAWAPQNILNQKSSAEPYIIISSSHYAQEIAAQCRDNGLRHIDDYVTVDDLVSFRYAVDISNVCNLKCFSCPRGNWPRQPKPLFMSLEDYKKVLDKIVKDDPLVWDITLFNWGEALLNPAVADIVDYTTKKGLHGSISTNLNYVRHLEDVIAAKVSFLRISTSGCGKNYEETHTDGKWEDFLANMYKLAKLREKLHPTLEVEVSYHIYKGRQNDYKQLKAICEELNFNLRPTWAYILPMDNMFNILSGLPVSQEAERTMSMQVLPPKKIEHLVRQQKKEGCWLTSSLAISSDLQILPCTCYYDPALPPLTSKNFLETSLEELVSARRDSPLCRKCLDLGVHHYYRIWDEKNFYIDSETWEKEVFGTEVQL